jgi:hypothetical protein
MIRSKNNIKTIKFNESEVRIVLNFSKKLEIYKLEDINSVFIKIKRIKDFYFVDLLSLIIIIFCFIARENNSLYSFYFSLFLLVFWTLYFINNRVYFFRIKLKNGNYYNYYFSKSVRYDILEKVKMIRGKIVLTNFNIDAI